MSEQQITTAVDQLVSLALEGKWEVAYEKYYHPELEKTDLDGVPVKGITQNIENGRAFAARISNVRQFSCAGKIIAGNRSFICWIFDFDLGDQPFKVTEVAIQDWENGQIIRERFFA